MVAVESLAASMVAVESLAASMVAVESLVANTVVMASVGEAARDNRNRLREDVETPSEVI